MSFDFMVLDTHMGLLDNIDNNDSSTSSDERKISYDKPGKGKISANFIGVILLIVFTVFGSFYVIRKKPEILGLSQNAQIENQKEIKKYVEEVGKLMLLPDETPTLATVTDLDKVKNQDFFKNAKEGDKVLVYVDAKKAILYRPSENKIIEVGTVNTSQSDNQSSNIQVMQPSTTPTPSVSVPSPTSNVTRTNTTPTPTGSQN